MNQEAADLYLRHKKNYEEKVKKYVVLYAGKKAGSTDIEINLENEKPKKIEFLKRKRRAKRLEFYYDKEFNDKNIIENEFMEEEELDGDMGSDLDKSGISSSSELNDELAFGKNYLGEK